MGINLKKGVKEQFGLMVKHPNLTVRILGSHLAVFPGGHLAVNGKEALVSQNL